MAAAKSSVNSGNFCNFILLAVPSEKRLIITNLSGNLALAGTATAALAITLPNRFAFNEKVPLFAEAGRHRRSTFTALETSSIADRKGLSSPATGWIS